MLANANKEEPPRTFLNFLELSFQTNNKNFDRHFVILYKKYVQIQLHFNIIHTDDYGQFSYNCLVELPAFFLKKLLKLP